MRGYVEHQEWLQTCGLPSDLDRYDESPVVADLVARAMNGEFDQEGDS
jgi:hypothetical protein